ncbi:MAG: DUF1116 domain-containing protein [bacterium]
MRRIGSAHVFWVGMSTAGREVHWLREGRRLLHAGSPLPWNEMCGAMRNAAIGAIVYQRWAETLEEAQAMAERGEVEFASAHAYGMLGPMAGIVSPAMPVFIVENRPFSNRVFITINEGLGQTLRFGANGSHVIERLRWIERYFAPLLEEAIALGGEVDISAIIERALQRGDECHNRNKSATSLLFRRIAPWLVRSSFSKEEIAEALFFIDRNDQFFLNLSMAASKATMDNVRDIRGSTIVSCMAANGFQFAIQVAGLGSHWFTTPAPLAEGRYFQGYGEQDANPVMGDSYLSEATGLGGVAMAAAPAITSFVGGTVQDALTATEEMYRITAAEHPRFRIPFLDYRGTPLGIDVRKVVELQITPVINTGIAHRLPGIGQIGAGLFRPPLDCFTNAYTVLTNQ